MSQQPDPQASPDCTDAQIAQISNSAAPVYSFPNEILTAIFEVGYSYSLTFPVVVSHVTHRLREVAIGSPTLWRHIFVAGVSLDQVETYLHRSRGCLLEITLSTITIFPKCRAHFESTLRHISRWRSLYINLSTTGAGFRDVLEYICTMRAPCLKVLDVRGYSNELITPQFFVVGAPMLSHITLTAVEISPTPTMFPMSAITSLAVRELSFSSCSQLCTLLLACPLLTEFTIWADGWAVDRRLFFANGHTNAYLPSLLSMYIRNLHENIRSPSSIDYLTSICTVLVMPSIRHLSIQEGDPSLLTHFAAWVSGIAGGSRYPALRSLELPADSPNDTLKNLANGLPNITKLTLLAPKDSVLTLLCDSTIWPHLNVLNVKFFDKSVQKISALQRLNASRPAIIVDFEE
jgi:hypothetical protein